MYLVYQSKLEAMWGRVGGGLYSNTRTSLNNAALADARLSPLCIRERRHRSWYGILSLRYRTEV